MENKDFKKLIETARQVMSTDEESLTEHYKGGPDGWYHKFVCNAYGKVWCINHYKEQHPDEELPDWFPEVPEKDAEQQQSADRIATAQKAIANFISQSQQNTQQGTQQK